MNSFEAINQAQTNFNQNLAVTSDNKMHSINIFNYSCNRIKLLLASFDTIKCKWNCLANPSMRFSNYQLVYLKNMPQGISHEIRAE